MLYAITANEHICSVVLHLQKKEAINGFKCCGKAIKKFDIKNSF